MSSIIPERQARQEHLNFTSLNGRYKVVGVSEEVLLRSGFRKCSKPYQDSLYRAILNVGDFVVVWEQTRESYPHYEFKCQACFREGKLRNVDVREEPRGDNFPVMR